MIDVKKIADLAKIHLSEEELQKFEGQLRDILKHFQALQSLDTSGVQPLLTPIQIKERLREDVSYQGLDTELALASAPERAGQLFKVPPVI